MESVLISVIVPNKTIRDEIIDFIREKGGDPIAVTTTAYNINQVSITDFITIAEFNPHKAPLANKILLLAELFGKDKNMLIHDVKDILKECNNEREECIINILTKEISDSVIETIINDRDELVKQLGLYGVKSYLANAIIDRVLEIKELDWLTYCKIDFADNIFDLDHNDVLASGMFIYYIKKKHLLD